jgi:pimeloyl-ACP methyl ester carboxylesterase
VAALMALSSFVGGRLWGVRYGDGPPWVLALHGWARDHRDFEGVLGGFDAVAVDLPGFGASPEPPGPWSTSEYARVLAAVLDECFGEVVVVVGHSFGARVAVRLAADRRVAALVLTGAPLAPPPGRRPARPALAFRAVRALRRAGLVSEARMEAARHRHGSQDYKTASPTMRGVLVKAVAETASGAYLPALGAFLGRGGGLELVSGELDQVAPIAGVEQWLAARQGDFFTTVVPGAGHLVSPPVAEALAEALARRRPGARS